MFDSKELSWIRFTLEQELKNNNWERNAEYEMRYLIAKVYRAELELKEGAHNV